MKLIGMLDSPYVRRVAISFDLLGIPFEHESLSVFSNCSSFQALNPVIKAPTLICDDGRAIMDSTLIIDYAEKISGKTLMPSDKITGYSILGFSLAACDKTVAIAYERKLRPQEKQHGPWLDRLCEQAKAAFQQIESAYDSRSEVESRSLTQENITVAASWQFAQIMTPDVIVHDEYPNIIKLSKTLEENETFVKYPPLGPGILPSS